MKTRASLMMSFVVLVATLCCAVVVERSDAAAAPRPVANTAPRIRPIDNRTVGVGHRLRIRPIARDRDGRPRRLSFSTHGRPRWISLNSRSGVLKGTAPRRALRRTYTITLRVTDGAAVRSERFRVRVVANRRPTLRPIPDRRPTIGKAFIVRPRAGDRDRGPKALRFSARISSPQRWMKLNRRTGVLWGTPPRRVAGMSYRVRLRVTDGAARTARVFVVRVRNKPPRMMPKSATVTEGRAFSIPLGGRDPDRAPRPLRYTMLSGPAYLVLDATRGVVRGTPPHGAVDPGRAVFRVSDGKRYIRRALVLNVNAPPAIDPVADIVATEGVALGAPEIRVADADGDAVAITSDLDVDGLTLTDNGDGTADLIGTPAEGTAAARPYRVTVTADDGIATTTERFEISITDPDVACAPITTEPCRTVPVGPSYALTFGVDGTEGGLDGTGFTMVDAPSRRASVDQSPASRAPTDPGAPGFEPGLLDVSGGNLTITATRGSHYGKRKTRLFSNSQINALGVGVSGAENGYRLETTLVAPIPPGTDFRPRSQQGGLWFGLDQDDYVKLVAVRVTATKYKVQLLREVDGISVPLTDELTSIGRHGQRVHLVLEVEDTAGTGADGGVIRGFYAIDDDPLEPLTDPNKAGITELPIPQSFFDGVNLPTVDPVSFAGVFASKRGQLATEPFAVTFEDFEVTAL
jgi:hypothetical protein